MAMTDDEIVSEANSLMEKLALNNRDKAIVSSVALLLSNFLFPVCERTAVLSTLSPERLALYALALAMQTCEQAQR